MSRAASETDLAYLAGIVDADGFVSIQRARKPQGTYYNARIGITGSRRQPHDLAASIFGGNVNEVRSRESRGFAWVRSCGPAVPVISALVPYLRIKLDQALLALELQEVAALVPSLWPFTFGTQMDDLYQRCREMKTRRGRTPKAGGRLLDGREWSEYPEHPVLKNVG